MDRRIGLILCLLLIIAAFVPLTLSVYARRSGEKPPLERRVFIHYRRGFGKPEGTPGRGPPLKEEDHSKHYRLLGKGVKWKDTPVVYYIDPDNPQGLDAEFICEAIFLAAEEWDEGLYSQLTGSETGWGGVSIELFADDFVVIYDATFDTDAPDGRNEILFGDYPEEGVIAVTVVWGYFSGPPSEREIIEFDIMFDIDYLWGDADVDSGVMDLQNIATHELGHGIGLDDYYQCELETMYGYSTYGETIKRDLYYGDIAGVQELYG